MARRCREDVQREAFVVVVKANVALNNDNAATRQPREERRARTSYSEAISIDCQEISHR
jgi:hypothetical protein